MDMAKAVVEATVEIFTSMEMLEITPGEPLALDGRPKPFLSDKGKDINLSIPSTVYGDEYTFLVAEGTEQRIVVPFTLKEKTFLIELQLKKE